MLGCYEKLNAFKNTLCISVVSASEEGVIGNFHHFKK